MADSASLRTRRSRGHKAGDHALCRPDRCPDAPIPTRPAERVGEIEAALASYLAGIDLPDDDPRALLAAVAMRLAKSLDRHATASISRELRGCVAELIDLDPDDDAGEPAAARLLRDLKELTK